VSSIRMRILVPAISLILLGGLLISGLTLYYSQRRIEEVYDAQLVQGARLLQGLLPLHKQDAIGWRGITQTLDTALNPSSNGSRIHPYEVQLDFQVWTQEGQLLIRSGNSPQLDIPPELGFQSFIYDAKDWRGVLLNDNVQKMNIWVGERDDLRRDVISGILQHALVPTLIGLPVLMIIIRLIVGWGLKPLQRFTDQARTRSTDSLELLSAELLPPELEPMRVALDRQREQLRELLERERRFITDAAHELRTPLAILDIHARNAREAGSVEEREAALGYVQHGLERAARIASQLLTIARLEPRQNSHQLINLTALVREELAELAPLALKQSVELALDCCENIHLMGDPLALTIMLKNLISNALNFTPVNSEVCVRLRHTSDKQILMEVLDQGPGVSENDLERLCERFYSSGNPTGAGLGLSIVELISHSLGGRVSFLNRREGGLCVRVLLPEGEETLA
jgi:two-component system sensor histidine kinase QseC